MSEQVVERSGARAVERAVIVLNCFEEGDAALALSDVARRAGLPLSTAYRIVQALVRGGLLQRAAGDHYQVGRRLVALGDSARARIGMDAAAPHLYALAAGIKLTVSFGIPDDRDVLTVLSARPPGNFCQVQIPDVHEPLHASALGKTVLAFVPGGPRAAALCLGPLESFTWRTHTSPTTLLGDLGEVRRRGFAVSDEERTEGVRALAVPVFGAGEGAVGALGVQARSARLTDDLIGQIVPALRHFAREVGRRLVLDDTDTEGTSTMRKGR